jgi:hypothetical protein
MGSLSLRPGDLLTIPKMALSVGFIRFVSSTDATQAKGLLTFTPVGLPPTEHVCLSWTHSLPQIPSSLNQLNLNWGTDPMFTIIFSLFSSIRQAFRTCAVLHAEILAFGPHSHDCGAADDRHWSPSSPRLSLLMLTRDRRHYLRSARASATSWI